MTTGFRSTPVITASVTSFPDLHPVRSSRVVDRTRVKEIDNLKDHDISDRRPCQHPLHLTAEACSIEENSLRMDTRSNIESTYELEIIRPRADDVTEHRLGDARKSRTSLSDGKQDIATVYLERETVPEDGTINVIDAESPPPDGGYGWVIVGACFIIT